MTIQRFASVWDAIEGTPEEAENMNIRSMLMKALMERIENQHLTQPSAAKMFRFTQPRVSDLLRGKSNLFAIDALVNMAAASGLAVELRLKKAPVARKRMATKPGLERFAEEQSRQGDDGCCPPPQRPRMITIMRPAKHNARAAAKEASHERILSVAARAIRRSGYAGTGVADIMKEAGLTHGGFYAHFPSREAMLAEAASRACAESAAAVSNAVASVPTEQALKTILRGYLSRQHLEQIESGCPLAALGSETVRQAPGVRRATTQHVKAMVDLVARQSPDWGKPAAHERALLTVAAMVGTLVLARAVDEPALSDSLREAALKYLAPA